MASEKEISDADQAMAQMADTFPSFWWRMYKNCVAEGFTESQAMQIILIHITTLGKR